MSRYGKPTLRSTPTSPTQLSIQAALQKEREKPEPQQKIWQDQIALLNETISKNHEEIREKFAENKKDSEKITNQLEEIKQQNEVHLQMIRDNELKIKQLEEKVEIYEKRLEKVEEENDRLGAINQELEGAVSLLELEKANYFLRFRNVVEEKEEDIKHKIINLIAENLEADPEEIREETDDIYRLNSAYAKRNRVPREVHVKFTKKTIRDEILKRTRDNPMIYRGKTVDILKQTPKRIRDLRKQYHFLTNKLIQKRITFRWINPEGVLIMWDNTRYYLNSIWKAKEFEQRYRTLLGEVEIEETVKERSERETPLNSEKETIEQNKEQNGLQLIEKEKENEKEQRITRSTQARCNSSDGK